MDNAFLPRIFYSPIAPAKSCISSSLNRNPFFDYHCHILRQTSSNRRFENLTQIWLAEAATGIITSGGRARQRSAERFITGNAATMKSSWLSRETVPATLATRSSLDPPGVEALLRNHGTFK